MLSLPLIRLAPAEGPRLSFAMRLPLILAACALAAGRLSAADLETVQLGTFKFVSAAPAFYMAEIAEKHGLEIKTQLFTKGADIIPAVVAGKIDVATTAGDAAVAARAGGVPITVVGGYAKGGVRLIVRSDLAIADIKGLKGKKVAVARGGAQETVLLATLDAAGMTYSNTADGGDVQIVAMPYTDANQALQRRDIDAACQPDPQAAQAIRLGFAKELMKPYATPIGEPVRVLLFTDKLIKERPEVARRLAACFVESVQWLRANPAEAEKFVREKIFGGQLTHEDYVDSMGNVQWTTEVSAEHMQAVTDAMVKFGLGRFSRAVRPSDYVRTGLVDEARKKAEQK